MAPRRTTGYCGLGAAIAVVSALVQANAAVAQVPAEVEIHDGRASTLVRNASRTDVDVEIALWESDETGERVELLRRADVNIWPTDFRLRPGETQTVRLLTAPDAYPANTLLRFETRFIPVEATPVPTTAGSTAPAGAEARLRLVTRILSKVWIR
jgi:P pilus assembly chaperone PapD